MAISLLEGLLLRASRGTPGTRGTLAVFVVVSMPSVALACPVCFSIKNEANQVAYLATTGFMTLVPLLVVAGAVWWLRKRAVELSRPVPMTADGSSLRVVRSAHSDASAAKS